MHDRSIRRLVPLLLLLVGTAAAGPPDREVDPRWLDRLDRVDRGLLDELIGYAPPAFDDELQWTGTEPRTWSGLRGKVVVIHSWSIRTAAGRAVPTRLGRLAQRHGTDDLVLLALHTPEGADDAATFLARRPAPVPVIVDSRGDWCDELGVFRRPVNIVVDRRGAVRYAGLDAAGLEQAVGLLLDETHDPTAAAPEPRPVPPATPETSYPPFQGEIAKAHDVRGGRAPELMVDRWLTERPDPRGKVVLVDFWATWCGPCVASIPHLNELATTFGDDLVVVGLSDERPDAFLEGLSKRRLDASSFRYALALDPEARTKKTLAIRAIPHALVMSSDWVVRWQGHPAALDEATLARIIAANKGEGRDTTRAEAARSRWRAWSKGRT